MASIEQAAKVTAVCHSTHSSHLTPSPIMHETINSDCHHLVSPPSNKSSNIPNQILTTKTKGVPHLHPTSHPPRGKICTPHCNTYSKQRFANSYPRLEGSKGAAGGEKGLCFSGGNYGGWQWRRECRERGFHFPVTMIRGDGEEFEV